MTMEAFKELAEKNKNKELVILMEGKAISTHFPCSTIADKPLLIEYIARPNKEVSEDEESKADSLPIGNQSGEVILFHVGTSGEKNTKRILKNQEIKSVCEELTIYAYEGETVADALQRDGRFKDSVFESNLGLKQTGDQSKSEFSNVVSHTMNNKLFKIYSKPGRKRKRQQKSQPGNSGEAAAANEGGQNPSQLPPTTETENDSAPNEKPKQNESEALPISVHEIPNSEKLVGVLTQKFKLAMKIDRQGTKTFLQIQELLNVEYGKNDETCREVRVMKKLMKLSDYVCLVAIDDTGAGTGFLLFGQFILTNHHVVKDVLEQPDRISVHFMYEEIATQPVNIKVEEVVAGQCDTDVSGNSYDWALLKLTEDVSASCLLEHFGYLPASGSLCIIGHPDSNVKKVDPCYIIPTTDYNKTVDKQRAKNPQGDRYDPKDYGLEGSVQSVGPQFFENTKTDITRKKPILAYRTCFYFGSSGSPVFDNGCKVVAIHSGGYIFQDEQKKKKSVIEYGFLLSHIIENMIIELVHKNRFDVLSKYLSVDYSGKEKIRDGVKKLKESRGLTAFDGALQSDEVTKNTDTDLKDFFEFICSKEVSEMEVDE